MTVNKFRFAFYLNGEKAWNCDAATEEDAWKLFSIRKNISLEYLMSTFEIKQL
jgi:hypothetical protein